MFLTHAIMGPLADGGASVWASTDAEDHNKSSRHHGHLVLLIAKIIWLTCRHFYKSFIIMFCWFILNDNQNNLAGARCLVG